MTMDCVIDLLWSQVSDQVFIRKEDFIANLDGCEVTPYIIDGIPAFVVVTKGPEFHFVSLHTGHPITGKMIWEQLSPLFDRYGYATTKTPKGDARQHRFNLRFGFYVTGEDEYDVHYRIDKFHHA